MTGVYKTDLGDFTEIQPKVYVSDTVPASDLVVPASVSLTGDDQNLPIKPNTVFFTDHEAKKREAAYIQGNAAGDLTKYFNELSLLSNFSKANELDQTSDPQQNTAPLGIGIVEEEMSGEKVGAFALQTSKTGSGIIQIPTDSASDYLVLFAGVENIENLNVSKAYIEAFRPFIAAHELGHLHDVNFNSKSTRGVLIAEIEADHGPLRKHFNKDYNNFVMDMRALSSLNLIGDIDDHATHIWTEEYGDGTVPTELEAQNIMSAPKKIYERMVDKTAEAFPESPREGIMVGLESLPIRYGALKTLREQGAFNDIPNGNEYVDKYVAAAERHYNPEIIKDAPLDELRAAYLQQSPAAANAPVPEQKMPVMTVAPG